MNKAIRLVTIASIAITALNSSCIYASNKDGELITLFEQAEDDNNYSEQIRIGEILLKSEQKNSNRMLITVAKAYYKSKQYSAALATLEKAYQNKSIKPSKGEKWDIKNIFGRIYFDLGEYKKSYEYLSALEVYGFGPKFFENLEVLLSDNYKFLDPKRKAETERYAFDLTLKLISVKLYDRAKEACTTGGVCGWFSLNSNNQPVASKFASGTYSAYNNNDYYSVGVKSTNELPKLGSFAIHPNGKEAIVSYSAKRDVLKALAERKYFDYTPPAIALVSLISSDIQFAGEVRTYQANKSMGDILNIEFDKKGENFLVCYMGGWEVTNKATAAVVDQYKFDDQRLGSCGYSHDGNHYYIYRGHDMDENKWRKPDVHIHKVSTTSRATINKSITLNGMKYCNSFAVRDNMIFCHAESDGDEEFIFMNNNMEVIKRLKSKPLGKNCKVSKRGTYIACVPTFTKSSEFNALNVNLTVYSTKELRLVRDLTFSVTSSFGNAPDSADIEFMPTGGDDSLVIAHSGISGGINGFDYLVYNISKNKLFQNTMNSQYYPMNFTSMESGLNGRGLYSHPDGTAFYIKLLDTTGRKGYDLPADLRLHYPQEAYMRVKLNLIAD